MAKTLKPSQREKKRYIVFEITPQTRFSFQDVKDAILQACLRYLGEFGTTKARLFIIGNTYVPDKGRGILRATNKMTNEVKAALSMIKSIKNKKVTFNVIGVSGILKKAKYKFLLKE